MLSSLSGLLQGSGLVFLMIAAVILLVWLFTRPLKLALKLAIHAGLGFMLLFIVNFLGGFIGIHVAITWLSALIAGFFGIPGVIGLLIFNFLF